MIVLSSEMMVDAICLKTVTEVDSYVNVKLRVDCVWGIISLLKLRIAGISLIIVRVSVGYVSNAQLLVVKISYVVRVPANGSIPVLLDIDTR